MEEDVVGVVVRIALGSNVPAEDRLVKHPVAIGQVDGGDRRIEPAIDGHLVLHLERPVVITAASMFHGGLVGARRHPDLVPSDGCLQRRL